MYKRQDLHDERRLSDSRPEADRTAGEAPGQVRQDAESVPAVSYTHLDVYKRQAGISAMLKELVGTYQAIKGTEYLFSPSHEVVGLSLIHI